MIRQVLILLALLFATISFSGVNLKNGNFYISYIDIVVPGSGPKLEINRTYNSKSLDSGWFGFGWGSFYETKLVPSPDGSVVIHEHGTGGTTRFLPPGKMNVAASIDRVLKEVRKKTQLTEKAANALKEKLKIAELRHSYARRYGIKTEIKSGTKFKSTERGIQYLVRNKDHYLRTTSDGRKDRFNLDGTLSQVIEKDGHKVDFVYKKGELAFLKDNFAKQINFSWYSSGRVKEIWSAGDKKALFKYDKDDLIYSKDIGGNIYNFKYDGNHNLTKISYSDKTTLDITYDPKSMFATSVTDRNKEKVAYKYENNPKNPEDHFWTIVTKKGFGGKMINNKYEYENKNRKDGSKYSYRILTDINGVVTETVYSECCGLPEKIRRGTVVTNFKYTPEGLLLEKKSTTGEFSKLTYNKKNKKVQTVANNDGSTKFEYDKKGNLIKAISSKGKAVLLVYDLKNRITKMVDHDKKTKKSKTLAFKYNSLGKPIEIKIEKVGSISVDYDNYGKIKDVKSKDGQKMAVQVTDSFQNLMAIVKPAGVDLNI